MMPSSLFFAAAPVLALLAAVSDASAASTTASPIAVQPTLAQLRTRLEGERCHWRRLLLEDGCAEAAADAEHMARHSRNTVRTKTDDPAAYAPSGNPSDPTKQE